MTAAQKLASGSIIVLLLAPVCLAELLAPGPELVVFASQTNHHVVPGGSLDDVRLSIRLSVTDQVATMTFTNASVVPETSAVVKLIVLDLSDDDTGEMVLWNGQVLPAAAEISYSLGPYNTLPGYNSAITDGSSMIEFQADPPAPSHGIAPGESFQATFQTSLPDGSDIYDYVAFFDGGEDTATYTIGFHAIDAETVGGRSVSGVLVPEPATMALLGAGGLALIARRRKRASAGAA